MIDSRRRRQILQLLSSRFDFTFEPETFTGKVVRRQAKPGEGPSAWHECDRCGGAGTVRDRFSRDVVCPDCKGAKGFTADAYTGERVEAHRDAGNVYGTPYGMTFGEHFARLLERDTRTVPCPDCQDLAGTPTGTIRGERCRRCDGSGRASVPGSWLSTPVEPGTQAGGDPETALIEAIERRDQAGDYAQLDQVIAAMPGPVRRVLDLLAEGHGEDELSEGEQIALELALEVISFRMPAQIRVPAGVAANAKARAEHLKRVRGRGASPGALQQRDREIRKAIRAGTPTQRVAYEHGLSVSQVNRIVAGESDAA